MIWLPTSAIALFGIAMVIGHNLFDWVTPAHLGSFGWIATILHVPGPIYRAPGWNLGVGYVLIPWMGVMACGYVFGRIFGWPAEARQKLMLRLGIALTLAFIVVRGIKG